MQEASIQASERFLRLDSLVTHPPVSSELGEKVPCERRVFPMKRKIRRKRRLAVSGHLRTDTRS